MSDTPRTDAFLENALSAIHETETIEDFTRQLERELAAERERADRNQADADREHEDAERYRWILHQAPITDFIFVFTKSKERHVSNAIDAARGK